MNRNVKTLIMNLCASPEPQSIRNVITFEDQLKDLKIAGDENIYRILSTIKTFDLGKIRGVNLDKCVSSKQWRTLRTVPYQCCENNPRLMNRLFYTLDLVLICLNYHQKH